MQIFDFNDYRAYLKEHFSGTGAGRGKRLLLAQHLNCQPSFLTQVLGEKAHLSLEHAISVCEYLKLNESESQYFMLLVQKGKAGSKKLSDYFDEKISKIKEKRKSIDRRIGVKTTLSSEDQMTYYSVWYYSAIHILCALPHIKTTEDIANHLKLDLVVVKEALKFLEAKGFVVVEKGQYKIGSSRIHLKKGSAMLPRHHANWRMRAITELDIDKKEDLHYTAVLGISKSDYALFREKMLQLLQEFEPVITQSQDEVQVVMLMDLFQT